MTNSSCTRDEVKQSLKSKWKSLADAKYTPDQIFDCVQLYLDRQSVYQVAIKQLSEAFLTDTHVSPHVHSVRYRVKDPLHLAQKLASKALALDTPRTIRAETLFEFPEGITDLGGLRLLHLYKSDWYKIHEYISTGGYGKSYTKPLESIAYHRLDENHDKYLCLGDGLDFQKVTPHRNNYSSLHYIVGFQDSVFDNVYIEVQVRTLFEEGWGEIDHQWSYPGGEANKIVKSQLSILNKTASTANDIADALGQLNDIPTFIPWRLEQRLEKASEHVICATPNLNWACDHVQLIIDHLHSSYVKYTYWTMDWNPNAKSNEDLFRLRLTEQQLQDRVQFRHIPKGLKMQHLPVFSDLLLLKNVSDPWITSSSKADGIPVPRDLAIMAAPTKKHLQPEDHLDILISQASTVEQISKFFDYLEDSCS